MTYNIKIKVKALSVLVGLSFSLLSCKHKTKFDDFEIISAINFLIYNNIIIKNKYGFHTYLREYDNKYILSNNLTSENSEYTSYYIEYPILLNVNNYTDLL